MRVRALINYNDYELKRSVIKGEEYEVTEERAEVLLKGNASSNNKPFIEVVETECETADINVEDLEVAIVKPKRKRATKK